MGLVKVDVDAPLVNTIRAFVNGVLDLALRRSVYGTMTSWNPRIPLSGTLSFISDATDCASLRT